MTALWPFLAEHARMALFVTAALLVVLVVYGALARRFPKLASPTFDRILMPLAVLGYGTGYLLWGEKVSHQGGVGWDGIRFSAWAQDFHKAFFVDGQNHYYIQKSLPSAVVHYAMRALDVKRTIPNVIVAFGVLDIVCWTFVAIAWVRIAKLLAISRAGSWLGFALLFVSYSGLKHYFYNPVLVDSFGLMIAAGMLWAHLAGWNVIIAPLAFLGGFVIPGLLPLLGGILLCFARRETPVREMRGTGVALALTGATVIAFEAVKVIQAGAIIGNGAQQVDQALLPLSIAAMMTYLVVLCAPMLSFVPSMHDMRLAFRARWIPTFLVVVWGIHWVIDALKNRYTDVTATGYYDAVLMLGVVRPLQALVAHTCFVGPVFLLCIVMRRSIAKVAWSLGPGVVLATCVGFVLALDSESRHLVFFMPILATLVALAYDRTSKKQPSNVLIVTILSIFLSKAWLPHETPPLAQNYERLFLSMGPWMTAANYGAQAAATLACGIVLRTVFPR